jgi:hypothetical protein
VTADRPAPTETPLTTGSDVRVVLLKTGRARVEYDMAVIADDGEHLVLRGPWAEAEPRNLGFTTFEAGDVFTEHYWRHHWYSIKEVRDRQDRLKGWYCDVTRPVRVEGALVLSEDLILDLWASPDGIILLLDEEEFRASELPRSDPDAATHALESMAELERLARGGFQGLDRWHGEGRR